MIRSDDSFHDRDARARASFSPHPFLRNPHLQSVLASTRLRLLPVRLSGGFRVLRKQLELLLECGDGVRLQGFYSRGRATSERRTERGLVILLHGWEGSARSTYMLTVGEYLHRAGYDVVRLNLRDHGDTHRLNEGIFHANRLDEVVGALRSICRQVVHGPVFLVGFSLGGNFALRVALRASGAGLEIRRVIAVNPALNPKSILDSIDRYALYRRYFVKRWRRSLLQKQAAFPHLYDFREALTLRTVRGLTEHVIPRYTPFETIDDYLAGYTLTGRTLTALSIPTTILTAADDPIIAVEDFYRLPPVPTLRVEVHPRGGHCGYIEGPRLRPWLEGWLLSALSGHAVPASGFVRRSGS